MVRPPCSLIARRPSVPSLPVPGQDDADRVLALVLGQRAEEGVDRHAPAALLAGRLSRRMPSAMVSVALGGMT